MRLTKSPEKQLPRNKDIPYDKHKDKILRELDCTAIEFMHSEVLKRIQKRISGKRDCSDYKLF